MATGGSAAFSALFKVEGSEIARGMVEISRSVESEYILGRLGCEAGEKDGMALMGLPLCHRPVSSE